jgi:large subunit ribosomal protein L21
MYAIIKSGSKQYRVEKGQFIDVELLDNNPGDKIKFEEVLLLDDGKGIQVGAPTVTNCSVSAVVVEPVKGPKVVSYKFKRRKKYRRKIGHRQGYHRVEIQDIKTAAKKTKKTEE